MERQNNGVVAAFVALDWSDQGYLRLWAKTLRERSIKWNGPVTMVLLTDDVTDGNAVLTRQLRCSGIVSAAVRVPSTMRSQLELDRARLERDLTMANLADVVFDFGNVAGGTWRFPGKDTIVISRS